MQDFFWEVYLLMIFMLLFILLLLLLNRGFVLFLCKCEDPFHPLILFWSFNIQP